MKKNLGVWHIWQLVLPNACRHIAVEDLKKNIDAVDAVQKEKRSEEVRSIWHFCAGNSNYSPHSEWQR